jgi:hypothetical protein
MRALFLIGVALLAAPHSLFALDTRPNVAKDISSFVNLFIGTTNGGHAFPGMLLTHLTLMLKT